VNLTLTVYAAGRYPSMMARVDAYILVQTAVGASHVASDVAAIEGVEEAHDVSGPYDVIARVHASDLDGLGELIVEKIQSIDGITRTLTCLVARL
jgi:DNA-binding Lrp family transcriptional regulator